MNFREWLTNDDYAKVDGVIWNMPHNIYGSGCMAVIVDVEKLDQLWKFRSPNDYIPPGGKHQNTAQNVMPGRYKAHADNIAQGVKSYDMAIVSCRTKKELTGEAIWPPLFHVRDGRHRLAAFRDAGFKKIAVGVLWEDADALERICGAPKS